MKEKRIKGAKNFLRNLLNGKCFGYDKVKQSTLMYAQVTRTLRLEEAIEFTSQIYTNITVAEVNEVLKSLAAEEVLKCKPNGIYEVLVDRIVLKDVLTYNWRIPKSTKDKPGKCPNCGQFVKYRNRHSRANSGHTGDDCRLNIISSIMQD
jgi:hypothetical protein